ncbi:hypothetical protein GHW09_30165, partial [Pseudomonas aeruginosa]|nr:hypothetical protein [Pseudomonas aeruginosa]
MIHSARSMAGRRAGPLLALLLLGLATARAEPVDGLPLRAAGAGRGGQAAGRDPRHVGSARPPPRPGA